MRAGSSPAACAPPSPRGTRRRCSAGTCSPSASGPRTTTTTPSARSSRPCCPRSCATANLLWRWRIDTGDSPRRGGPSRPPTTAPRRANQLHLPIVLGPATPSLETLYNVERARYQTLSLPQRAGDARPPTLRIVDVRHQSLVGNLSEILLQSTAQHLARGQQVLLFLNRRGYAPTLLCHDCGWVARCRRCDAHLIYHAAQRRLRCHHCGAEQKAEAHCPACRSEELRPLGHGTERVEQVLRERFPDHSVARIDRDGTRRKGALQQLLDEAHRGEHSILIGTQMLAKGHHLPKVSLAAILDADQGLFSVDFRASESLAQLITQVAGRAGRAEHAGEVLIQTHHPDHPLLRTLLSEGYARFAGAALTERREAALPPYSYLVLLRVVASVAVLLLLFLLVVVV